MVVSKYYVFFVLFLGFFCGFFCLLFCFALTGYEIWREKESRVTYTFLTKSNEHTVWDQKAMRNTLRVSGFKDKNR